MTRTSRLDVQSRFWVIYERELDFGSADVLIKTYRSLAALNGARLALVDDKLANADSGNVLYRGSTIMTAVDRDEQDARAGLRFLRRYWTGQDKYLRANFWQFLSIAAKDLRMGDAPPCQQAKELLSTLRKDVCNGATFSPQPCKLAILGRTASLSHPELQVLGWLAVEKVGLARLGNMLPGGSVGSRHCGAFDVPLPEPPVYPRSGHIQWPIVVVFSSETKVSGHTSQDARVQVHGRIIEAFSEDNPTGTLSGLALDASQPFSMADLPQGCVAIISGMKTSCRLVNDIEVNNTPLAFARAVDNRQDVKADQRIGFEASAVRDRLYRLYGPLYRRVHLCGPACLLEASETLFVCCPESHEEAGEATRATRAAQTLTATALAVYLGTGTSQQCLQELSEFPDVQACLIDGLR